MARLPRALAAALAGAALAHPTPAAGQAPAAPTSGTPTTRVQYPQTRTVPQTDDYHGTRVADPYRWLEDLDGADTKGWIAAQNAVTFGYLDATAGRDAIKQRLTEMWNYPRVSLPYRQGGRLWFTKNTGLQRQSPYFTATGAAKGAAERATLILDPNEISKDGSTSLSLFSPDPTGTYVAYGLSAGGADWRTVKVKRVADGKDLDDTVDWLRYSGVSWTEDGKGFFYTRYPEPPKEAGKTLSNASRDPKVFYHALGTPQTADVEIFRFDREPTWGVGAGVSEDGRWLFAYVNRGTDPENHLYVADLKDPKAPDVRARLTPIDVTLEASFTPIGTRGTTAYVHTNLGAPKYKLVAIDLTKPARANWKTVIPESEHTLEGVALIGGKLFAQYLADVKSVVTIHDLAGTRTGELPLPGIGTLAGLSGREDEPELFFGFTSYLVPSSVYRYDVATGALETFFKPNVPFDASGYETKQVFFPSKDGTRIPMFVTHRKGMALDGTNPTMLYAYGGFNVNQVPAFSASVATWLEMGGVYAVPNLRGGGEYGEAWHQAGKLDKKQNVFDDFIGAAEYLIREKYTAPPKLAIRGGSNGGLLVGAVMTQRPELFGVALPAVGVMDMLRYHKFSAGVFWVPEYGSADDPQQFRTLAKYSPLHNLKPGACYPATLTTTADHDDRVVPGHSFKWASALQAAQGCDRPVLIRVEAQGSHGYRPLDKAIAEQADIWAFTARNLGVPVKFEQKRAME
ncbi:prolyl oligopeptidase family serine peptidase [Roseisolibacter sp. H3M3-2]|uniref:prolyl oligopeptidase family serine peptidase n=1 Tax=Roseisolibacter sp. H3M3-2 TaxID=3031323 RepID=UPI0023DC5360|nr:prolyl oligopeptidase family serine peptidase [Roseisolibacter sp. H3M3-2]MDF1505652.1 prolyl oligopeptidase family serine peptidase [Roseisolibacter sp. H3M3-2]